MKIEKVIRMKKILVLIAIIGIVFMFNNKQEEYIIPKEAIRFRVIANSDSDIDQNTKLLVRNTIQKQMTKDLSTTNSLASARTMLQNNVSNYEFLVEKTLKEQNQEEDFKVNYGMNYFPEKIYKGVKYEEGYYESLVVTLGNGMGNNWWCVLFPPLCLLEAEETEETTEVEYKFFIKELIDKYLK